MIPSKVFLPFLILTSGVAAQDFGDGSDGPLTVNSDTVSTALVSELATPASAGSGSITVASAGFATGDEILILTMFDPGGTGGEYEFHSVTLAAGAVLTLDSPLTHAYSNLATQPAQVVQVPNYSSVTISSGGVLRPPVYRGTAARTGGVLAFRCSGTLSVQPGGSVDASERGFRGGNEVSAGQPGRQGDGEIGEGTAIETANGGGGGGGETNSSIGSGGGGGGYATAGQTGPSILSGDAGNAYGVANLSRLLMGAGGGSGGGGVIGLSGAGGQGGGILYLAAQTINVQGQVLTDGEVGGSAGGGGGGIAAAGGGAGAGGSLYMVGDAITLTGTSVVSARGSVGGFDGPSNPDGDGGPSADGRIHIDYVTSISGTTDPAADVTQVVAPSGVSGYVSYQ